MSTQPRKIVEVGTVIYYPNGQSLTVENRCAVGTASTLYCTQEWADEADRVSSDWAERSWIRKLLSMRPKGYPDPETVAPSFIGIFSRFYEG